MGGRWGGRGRLFEAGRLLTFSAFRVGAYSRWALIRGWALIRINTVWMSSRKVKSRPFIHSKESDSFSRLECIYLLIF